MGQTGTFKISTSSPGNHVQRYQRVARVHWKSQGIPRHPPWDVMPSYVQMKYANLKWQIFVSQGTPVCPTLTQIALVA